MYCLWNDIWIETSLVYLFLSLAIATFMCIHSLRYVIYRPKLLSQLCLLKQPQNILVAKNT